jgi:hypothetical protein
MKQTTFIPRPLSQRDPAWKNETLGHDSLLTIGTNGSALTSLVMLVNGYGYNETPSSLNMKLKDGGFLGGLINWSALPHFFPTLSYKNLVICKGQPAPVEAINESLDSGQPVIAEISPTNNPDLENHWVVLVGRQGQDYLILDPYPIPADSAPVSLVARFGAGSEPSRIITTLVWYEFTGSSLPQVPSTSNFIEKDKNPKTDSDRPSGVDRLNYEKYAEAFAKIILNYETSTPLTIGIYGQWGQGKSFLMGKIKKALKDREKLLWFIRLFTWLKQIWDGVSHVWWIISNSAYRTKWFNGRRAEKEQRTEQKQATQPMPTEQTASAFSRFRNWIAIQRKIRAETVDWHVVEFNAWSYVGTDHLWAGLITHLYKEAEQYFGLRLSLVRLWRAIKRSLPKSFLIVVFYVLLGMAISLIINSQQIATSFGDLAVAVKAVGASALSAAGLASLPTLWTTLKEFADNLFLTRSKSLQNLAAKPDFSAQIGIMADIKEELHFIRQLMQKGKYGHRTRFILFIDDLDRCDHKKAVEVLQAIMLLLTDEDGAPFVIFLGLDARVLVRAIEATYGDVLVKAGINGYEYLDKIVQVPFVIPMPNDIEIGVYVDAMLWASQEEKDLVNKKMPQSTAVNLETNSANQTEEGKAAIIKDVEQAAGMSVGQMVTGYKTEGREEIPVSFTNAERVVVKNHVADVGNNPRKIKRIINIYRFTRQLLPTEYREIGFRWVLLTEQWPFHTAWLLEEIENDEQTKKNELEAKTILDVYDRVKERIMHKDMENLLGIDSDPDVFRSFIEQAPVFSVKEIKILRPYTFNLNPAIRSEVCKKAIKFIESKPMAEIQQAVPKPKSKKPASRKKKSSAAKVAA